MRKAALLVWLLCAARAQEIAGLDRYIRQQMEDKHLPGLSIALVDDQRVVCTKINSPGSKSCYPWQRGRVR